MAKTKDAETLILELKEQLKEREETITDLKQICSNLKNTIDEADKTIRAYKESGEKMEKDIRSMQLQIGGYKSAIAQQKKKIADLRAQVKGMVDFTKYQQVEQTCNEQAKFIDELRRLREDTKGEYLALLAKYESFIAMPWYKRLFFKDR